MEFRTPEDLLGLRKKFSIKPGMIVFAIAILAVLIAISTMFYSVGPDERGVVLFLGKYVRTTAPGLHMKIPFGVEKAIPVKVERIFKEEFGFRTTRAGTRSQYSKANYLEESLMLTGDLNALVVTWIVQFKVQDPVKLLFKMRNPVGTTRDISEAVMRRLVGDYSVDEVLTTKRAEINTTAKELIQDILDSYDSGIRIVTVKLQDVTPPGRVQAAFNEVNQAKQEKEKVINEALQHYNKIIPRAKGRAEKMLLESQAYAIERVNKSKGDADRFEALLVEYKKAPDVTKRRMYLEAIETVMSQPKEKYIIDPNQRGVIPLLDFRKGDQS